MEGCLRGVRSRKKTLDFAKGGMLGKHDLFEVVLDPATDPGADKRGLLRSGQVLSTGKDTGGTNSLPTSRNCSRKGAGIGAAQLLEFICTGLAVKPSAAQSLSQSRNACGVETPTPGCSYHAPQEFDVWEGVNLLSPIKPKDRSPDQKQRHV